jgi:hypothetical protein
MAAMIVNNQHSSLFFSFGRNCILSLSCGSSLGLQAIRCAALVTQNVIMKQKPLAFSPE